jgi:hypothetical protein
MALKGMYTTYVRCTITAAWKMMANHRVPIAGPPVAESADENQYHRFSLAFRHSLNLVSPTAIPMKATHHPTNATTQTTHIHTVIPRSPSPELAPRRPRLSIPLFLALEGVDETRPVFGPSDEPGRLLKSPMAVM